MNSNSYHYVVSWLDPYAEIGDASNLAIQAIVC